jgi:hypothetical protein
MRRFRVNHSLSLIIDTGLGARDGHSLHEGPPPSFLGKRRSGDAVDCDLTSNVSPGCLLATGNAFRKYGE